MSMAAVYVMDSGIDDSDDISRLIVVIYTDNAYLFRWNAKEKNRYL